MSSRPHQHLDAIPTPSLVVDRTRLDRNIERMEGRARELGVRLRPHLKTAKSSDVAERIPSFGRSGGTVSTPREAETFLDSARPSILYARTPAQADLGILAQYSRSTGRLLLAIDSTEAIELARRAADEHRAKLRLLIEIDCGEHRSGVAPDDPELRTLIEVCASDPNLQLEGVFTHGGQSYEARSIPEIRAVAEQERTAVVAAAEVFADLGAECPIRSAGSTPTVTHAEHYDGCTEVRAGVYVFQDLFQVGIRSCELDDLALSVATTVIGRRKRERRLLIDAGGLALSKDRSTHALPDPTETPSRRLGDCGYGLVCDATGEVLAGLQVVEAWQEHGVVEARPEFDLDIEQFPVGTRLRILPNHACMTAAAHDDYAVVDADGAIHGHWSRVNGW